MAMHVLTLLSVLLSLTTAGYALTCTKCKSTDLNPCKGDVSENCTADQQCMSIYATTVKDGKSADSVTRMCGLKDNCNKVGSYTTVNEIYKMSTTCCSDDLCVPKPGKLPDDFKNPNSHKCPYCKSDTESCSTENMLDCSGNENRCLTIVTKKTGSSQSVSTGRGCATKSVCDFGTKNYSDPINTIVERVSCRGGPAILCHSAPLTLYAVSFLLMKLFI